MPRPRRWALFSLLLLLGVSRSLTAETVGRAEYLETTGPKRVYLTSWETPEPTGYLLHSQGTNGEVHDLLVDKELRTVWWKFHAPDRGIDIRAVRKGNEIEITGTADNKPVSRTLQIDEAPWYQSLERSLVPLALGAQGGHEEFWVVQPYSLVARKIQATNEGHQTITVEGTATPTARVKISLPGFLAMFWSSSYWYRIPDGKFVKFEGLHGPPGTPVTTVRLLRALP